MSITIVTGERLLQKAFDWAVSEAHKSNCARGRCGAVIVAQGEVIGSGFNSPPAELASQQRCLRKAELASGFKSDRTCCVHAEERAIMDALVCQPKRIQGATLVFARIDLHGQPQLAGQPYCTICSKLALDVGLAEFVLWHADGFRVYGAEEFNDLSFAYDGET